MSTNNNVSVFEIIESDIETQPEVAIDKIIQQARKNVDLGIESVSLVCKAVAALGGASKPEDQAVDSFVCQLLDDPVRLRSRQLVAICLLRLLPEPGMEWLHDAPWRPRIISLFEQQLSEDFYSAYRIDVHAMAHLKIAALTEAVQKFDQNFQRALQTLTSLELLNTHRQRVMKHLNDKIGRLLAYPFLPTDLEALLNELFIRIQIYLDQRDSLYVVNAHAEAIAEVEQFITITTDYGTIYSLSFAEMVGRRLKTLIQDDFASNKAAQPAKVSVNPRDKKYPLHLVEHRLRIGFLVNNEGPGYAHETRLMVNCGEDLIVVEDEIEIGRMAPGTTQRIEIDTRVQLIKPNANFLLLVSWRNFDGSQKEEVFEFTILGQRSDIEWGPLAFHDPYSLEPVTNERDLVGRRDVLNRLIATAKATQAGSCFIQGQKRVGKTSIARALQSHLQAEDFLVIFLEGGDYVEPEAKATVARLGRSLTKVISRHDERLIHLPTPEFDEAISPLAEYFDDFHALLPEKRLIIILDEFDELPADLYARGPFGNSFFLTLRSLSSRPFVGFVLVGGEKMRNIMESQGAQLNKWNVVPVDYFSRETDWSDYRELVQRPASGILEYTEDSLVALHEVTAGNPYFTKLVCQNIFRMAVDRSDCYVTQTEINEAVRTTVMEAKINTFQHFWEDGLLEIGDRGKEKSVRRRKILIALSDMLQKERPAPKTLIEEHRLVRDIAALDSELQEFVTRQILVGDIQNELYDYKVPLFDAWLKTRGIQDVITEFADLDAAFKERQQEEALKVKPAEIVSVTGYLGLYKGQSITEDKVRAWLNQFNTIPEQRAMFTILAHLHYFSNDNIRQKMAEVHGIVQRGLTRYLQKGQVKRSDILVSYLDNPSKSSARFARLYADEAEIYVDNIVEKGELIDALQRENIQALVFVDDFVCTGTSAIEYLQDLNAKIADVVLNRGIKVVFVAVVAYKKGWQRIEITQEQLAMPISCHVCELLDERDQCFSEQSSVFPDEDQRRFAKQVASDYGRVLEKKWPLGYGNLGLAIVFERSCPNNSLPIFWAESSNWKPLFKRH